MFIRTDRMFENLIQVFSTKFLRYTGIQQCISGAIPLSGSAISFRNSIVWFSSTIVQQCNFKYFQQYIQITQRYCLSFSCIFQPYSSTFRCYSDIVQAYQRYCLVFGNLVRQSNSVIQIFKYFGSINQYDVFSAILSDIQQYISMSHIRS